MYKSSFIIFLVVISLGFSAVLFARDGGGGMGGYGQGNQGMPNQAAEAQERIKAMEKNRTKSKLHQPSDSQSKSQDQQQIEKQTRDQVKEHVETRQ